MFIATGATRGEKEPRYETRQQKISRLQWMNVARDVALCNFNKKAEFLFLNNTCIIQFIIIRSLFFFFSCEGLKKK